VTDSPLSGSNPRRARESQRSQPGGRHLDRSVRRAGGLDRGGQISLLLPIIRAQSAAALLRIGDALIRSPGCSGNVLGLVEVPVPESERLSLEMARRRRDLLRWIARLDQDRDWGTGTGLGILVRVVHDIALGIREAAYETGANVILVEWPGLASSRPHLLARVVKELSQAPPADLLLVRPGRRLIGPGGAPPRILAPVRGGPNAELASEVAVALSTAWGGTATLLHLVDRQHPANRRVREMQDAARLAQGLRRSHAQMVERETDDVGRAILAAAQHADVVVLGAYAERGRHPALVRPELAASLRKLEGTLILIRTMEAIRRS